MSARPPARRARRAPRNPLASAVASAVRERVERLVELGALPPSEAERAYAAQLLEELKRLSLSEPDAEREFAALLRRAARDELGVDVPLELELPPERAIERLLRWAEERAEQLAERLGLDEHHAADEQDLVDAVERAVLQVVIRAAERVLAWFEPRG